jgi:hypothetical protein
VRTLKELFEQAQLVHKLESRGVNRVAAKISKKIGVFFEDQNIHASAGQKIRKHHAGRAATDDAATGVYSLHAYSPLVHPEVPQLKLAGQIFLTTRLTQHIRMCSTNWDNTQVLEKTKPPT